jgi:hypothetical protein
MRLIACATALTAGASGCANFTNRASAVIFPANPNSWRTKGERTELKTVCKLDPDCTRAEAIVRANRPPAVLFSTGSAYSQQGLGMGEAAAAAVELALKQIGKFLEKEAERYTATYSATTMGTAFYTGWTTAADINLTGLTLARYVENETTPAMALDLDVNGSVDGTAFELRPRSVYVRKAKAKLPAFEWLDPVSWFDGEDNDLDLTVAVSIYGVWVDNSQKGHVDLVSDGSFKISNLELGQVYGVGGKPIPGGNLTGHLSPAVPRSQLGSIIETHEQVQVARSPLAPAPGFDSRTMELARPLLGPGNYFVTFLVTEHDDYGTKVKEAADALADRRENIVKFVEEK